MSDTFTYTTTIERGMFERIFGDLTDEQWNLWCEVMHEKFEAVGVLSNTEGTPIWSVLNLGTDNQVSTDRNQVKTTRA
jgi:hypothetical protein